MVPDSGLFVLMIDGNVIACGTANSVEITRAMRNVTCQDSGKHEDFLPGLINLTGSIEGLVSTNAGNQFVSLKSVIVADAAVTYLYKEIDNAGADVATVITGNCHLNNLSMSGGEKGGNPTYSASFQGTGAFT